jgi:hypothetical protein
VRDSCPWWRHASPNRISSSARGCPDRFNLDQPPWPVFAGWPRTVVNCNPNCNLLIRSKITPVQRRPQLSDRPAHAGRGRRSVPRSSEVVHGRCSIRINEMCRRPLSGGGAVHACCTILASPCGGCCHVNAFPAESAQLRGAATAGPRAHRARRRPVHSVRPQRSYALPLRFLLGPRPLVAVAAL